MNRKTILKSIAIILVIIGFIWFNQTFLNWSPEDLQSWILSLGWYAPLIYFLIYTIRSLILFPPSILSLAGGLAFGPIWGTVLTVISATSSASLSFFVARTWGKNLMDIPANEKMESIQRILEKRGFIYVLLTRLIPVIPFDLISYTAGISRIRFRAFFWGTFFGIIPGTFAYNLLGSSLFAGNLKDWLIAIVVFLVALTVPLRFRKWLEGRDQE